MPTTPTAPTAPTVEVRIDVPAPLHRLVKVRAAQDGLTVKGAMLAALGDWVAPTAKPRAPGPDPAQVRAQVAEEAVAVLDRTRDERLTVDQMYAAMRALRQS